MGKSEAELEAERKQAAEKLEGILNTTRPKNLREGVGSGMSNIVSGAVGGAGVAVLLPYVTGNGRLPLSRLSLIAMTLFLQCSCFFRTCETESWVSPLGQSMPVFWEGRSRCCFLMA